MNAMHAREMKIEKINLRAPSIKKELIDHAADVAGKSRTDFMLDASCEKAQELLADQTNFRLNEDQLIAFNRLLEAPLANPDAIARLLAKRSPWEV